jgi:hypothetical protein
MIRTISSNVLVQLLHRSIARNFTTNQQNKRSKSISTISSGGSASGKQKFLSPVNSSNLIAANDRASLNQFQEYFLGRNAEEVQAQIQSFIKVSIKILRSNSILFSVSFLQLSLFQIMTRNKRYLDFVDFALLYIDILRQQDYQQHQQQQQQG